MSQRWAIVGTGTISRSIVADLRQCTGVSVTLVQSRDPDNAARFAEEFDIPSSTGSYDDVLYDPDIDVVYIATPFALHHTMARRAILAGKHVLVEKPMAMDTGQVADLFTLAAEQGVFVMEAMWFKFTPLFARLRAELDAGRIGEVRSVRAGFSAPFPQDGGSRWDLARSPGSLLDQGIYPVTLAHAILGEPSAVYARGTVRSDGIDLTEHFTLEFAGGKYAHGASGMTEFTDLTAAVSGTSGWITLTAPFWATSVLEIHADDMEKIFRTPERVETQWIGNGYVPMLQSVADAIGRGETVHPTHNAADTLAVFRVLDEIRTQITGAS